ncbi:uncharacterized protein LOC135808192 [Sycon ciliatum]|uniref:uncharacterized protein LOC135808192 n=1 Tax=Sycon ciliatum TaxID=27933 RepID=UPI0031F6D396
MANGPPSEHRQYPYPNAYAESAKWLRQRTGDHAFTNHLLECKKSHEGDVDFRGRPPIPDDHHGVTVTYPRHAETLASLGLDPLPGEGEHAQRRPVAYRPPTPYQHKPTANDFGWSEEERMAPPEPQQPQPIIKKPRDAEAVNRHRFVSAPVRPSTGKVVLERRKPGTATSSSIGQPAREPRHVRFRLTPEVHTFDGASETQQINDMHDRAEESIAGHSGLSGWSPTLTSSSPTSRSAGIYAEPQVSMETKTALQHTAAGRASRGQLERTASSSKPHNTSRDVLTTAPREGHYHPWPAREGEPEVHRELFGGGSLAPFQNGKGLRQWAHDLFERNYKQRFTLKLDHELRVTRGQATHSYFEGVMVGDTRDGPGLDITDRGDIFLGQYKKGRRTGVGMYVWVDTNTAFLGQYHDKSRTGRGVRWDHNRPHLFQGEFTRDQAMGPGVGTYGTGRQDAGVWQGDMLEELEFPVATQLIHLPLANMKGRKCTGCHLDDITTNDKMIEEMTTVFEKFQPQQLTSILVVDMLRERFGDIATAIEICPTHSNYCLKYKPYDKDPLEGITNPDNLHELRNKINAQRNRQASAGDIDVAGERWYRAENGSVDSHHYWDISRQWSPADYVKEVWRMKMGDRYRWKKFKFDTAVQPECKRRGKIPGTDDAKKELRLRPERFKFFIDSPARLVVDGFVLEHGRPAPPGPLVMAAVDFLLSAWNGFGVQLQKWLDYRLVCAEVIDRHNHAALFLASVRGHLHCVQTLLLKGAKVNRVTLADMTPFSATFHVMTCLNGFVTRGSPLGMDGDSPLRYIPHALGGNGFRRPPSSIPNDKSIAIDTSRGEIPAYKSDTGEPYSWDTTDYIINADELALVHLPGYARLMGKSPDTVRKKMAEAKEKQIMEEEYARKSEQKLERETQPPKPAKPSKALRASKVKKSYKKSRKDPVEEKKVPKKVELAPRKITVDDVKRHNPRRRIPSWDRWALESDSDDHLPTKSPGDKYLRLVCSSRTVPREFAGSQKQRLKWCVDLLLLRNADVTLVQQPEPVVMCAIKSEDTAIVRLVVAKGADCDSQLSPDNGDITAMHYAANMNTAFGCNILWNLLQSGYDPNCKTEYSPICRRETDKQAEARMRKLHNASVDHVHVAVLDPCDWSDIEKVSERRMPMDTALMAVPRGWTPLHLACAHRHRNKWPYALKMVKDLLKHGACPDALTDSGHSPLSLALNRGNDGIAFALLEGGALPNLRLGTGICSAICQLMTGPSLRTRSNSQVDKVMNQFLKAGVMLVGTLDITRRMQGSFVDYLIFMYERERKRCRLLLGDKYSDRDLYFRFDHVRSILTQLGRSHISIIEANNYATSIIQRSEDQKRLDKRREAIDQLHAAERQRQRKDSHTMLRKDDPDYIRSLAKGVNKKVLLDIPKEQWPLLATPGMKPIPANVRDIFLSRPEEGECSSEGSSSYSPEHSTSPRQSATRRGSEQLQTTRRRSSNAATGTGNGADKNKKSRSSVFYDSLESSNEQDGLDNASDVDATHKSQSGVGLAGQAHIAPRPTTTSNTTTSATHAQVRRYSRPRRQPSASRDGYRESSESEGSDPNREVLKAHRKSIPAAAAEHDRSSYAGRSRSAPHHTRDGKVNGRSGSVKVHGREDTFPSESESSQESTASNMPDQAKLTLATRSEIQRKPQPSQPPHGEPLLPEDSSLFDKQCYHCFKVPCGKALTACFGCGIVKYCSKDCVYDDWYKTGHSKECFDRRVLEAAYLDMTPDERRAAKYQLLENAHYKYSIMAQTDTPEGKAIGAILQAEKVGLQASAVKHTQRERLKQNRLSLRTVAGLRNVDRTRPPARRSAANTQPASHTTTRPRTSQPVAQRACTMVPPQPTRPHEFELRMEEIRAQSAVQAYKARRKAEAARAGSSRLVARPRTTQQSERTGSAAPAAAAERPVTTTSQKSSSAVSRTTPTSVTRGVLRSFGSQATGGRSTSTTAAPPARSASMQTRPGPPPARPGIQVSLLGSSHKQPEKPRWR